MIHHIEPAIWNMHGNWDREMEPILTIEPGDTIIAATRCCDWGDAPPCRPGERPTYIPREARRDPENDIGLSLVGPIAVRGAVPGMTLEVEIEDLKVGAYGITITAKGAAARAGVTNTGHCVTWTFDETGVAIGSNGFRVKTRPFLGCIGVTPDLPDHPTNTAPRSVGGNMDCKELVAGTKLYLPVAIPGALLSFGDGHAAQGDGEMCGYAIECPMETVRLTVRLHEDMKINYPVAKTPDAWLAFGFDETVDAAMRKAISNMLDLMVERLGISRDDAYALAGQVVDLRITQIANPLVGVHAVWPDGSMERG